MKKEIVSRFEITKELYTKWVLNPVSAQARKENRTFLILNIIGIVISAAVIVTSIITKYSVMIFLGAIFLLVFVYRQFIRKRMLASKYFKRALDNQRTDKWIRTVSFSDSGKIDIKDSNVMTSYSDADVTECTEDSSCVYVILKGNNVIRLPKDSFVSGSPEELLNRYVSETNC